MNETFDATIRAIYGHPAQGNRVSYASTFPLHMPTKEQIQRILSLVVQAYVRELNIPKDTIEATSLALDWDEVTGVLEDAKGGRGALFPDWLKIAQKAFELLGNKHKLADLQEIYPSVENLPENVKFVVDRLLQK